MEREGVAALLEGHAIQIMADGDDREAAIRLARIHRPDAVILDLALPPIGVVECAREILSSDPKLGIVLLTPHAHDDLIVASLRAGIRGCVVKTQTSAELVKAIREVSAGRTYLSAEASSVVARMCVEGASTLYSLTPRLSEVLRLIADGNTTREVAAILGVSEKTAELYRSRIMAKLDVHDTAGLVRYAIRHGLVEL
jgi:DNA-binding NarL/FixJ family response regulator